jgi:TRAP-type uncharacterized transport system fused permease subunit
MGTHVVSFMFVVKPAPLLFGADPQQIVIVFISSAIGIAAVCTAFSGTLLLRFNWVERVVEEFSSVFLY